ncbi:hypothetical protein SNE40_007944 [Patella caerulea]|uniref:RRM domain-containing protein n=1 Tax=Patella caerulea TaxID=87958 RepID=A0AAN8JXV2_PATCE
MGEFGIETTNIRALSPVDFDQLSNNQYFFAPDPVPVRGKMQDDALLDKTAAISKQAQQIPVSTNGSDQNEDSLLKKMNNGVTTFSEEKICVPTVSQVRISEPTTSAPTTLSSAQGYWSSAPADDTFVQGFQSLNGTVTFQQFSPSTNATNMSNVMFNTGYPGQVGVSLAQQSQSQRRAITAHHNFPQRQPNILINNAKSYPNWSNAPVQSWSGQQNQATLSPWTNVQQQRRSVPNINALGPMKKPNFQHVSNIQQSSMVAPSKFRRSTSFPGQIQQAAMGMKQPFEYSGFEDLQNQREGVLPYQNERPASFDTMRFPALESQLLDIMRTTVDGQTADHFRGKAQFHHDENHLLDDGSLDQTVPNISGSLRGSPNSQPGVEHMERFSRKVFVGGLPPDIDEEEITAAFRRFGPLVVDWPHKAESKSYFPPKGYCFLIFQDELSVQALVEASLVDDDKLYWCVSSPTMKDKPVQIRPWNLSDSDFVMDGSQPLDPRKTIFVGGVPRPLRAVELAMIMDRLYGGVCYAGIDTDPELKYPKGAGRVAFSNQQSYIAAISARFVQLQHGDIDKRVEVKPYVLDDQMCDECQGARCGGKFAPFFCANVTCLQYYCEYCWAQIHSRPGREFHKPLVKEGADRPRAVPFRWC